MRLFDLASSRRSFAVALVLLVAVAGYMRGVVVSDALAEPAGFTLCHGAAAGTPSGDTVNHSCCDDCVVAAAIMAPAPPVLSLPAEIIADAGLERATDVAPAGVRLLTPRLSQGPPGA
jgi:hypothetical protein